MARTNAKQVPLNSQALTPAGMGHDHVRAKTVLPQDQRRCQMLELAREILVDEENVHGVRR